MSDVIAEVNNRYHLYEVIGSGGMGTVYRAFDRLNRVHVALKQVKLELDDLSFNTTNSGSDDERVILMREFQILARLRHPHIIEVLDFGFNQQRQPYYTMQLLENPQDIVSATSALPFDDRIQICLDMLRALEYLHQHGIVHRDLKPGNILLDESGLVRIVDFGLAMQADKQEETAGTLAYMAPELFHGEPASIESDLFALGVIAYQILTGDHPFYTGDLTALLYRLAQDPPEYINANLPQVLRPIFNQLFTHDPEDRYHNATAVIQSWLKALKLPEAPETKDIRESYLQTANFVGRDEEFQQLSKAVTDLQSGLGSLWMIGGESGVGKSRLLNEIRIQALVNGVIVFTGQSSDIGSHPYDLWQDIIPQLLLETTPTLEQSQHLLDIVSNVQAYIDTDILPQSSLQDRARFQALTISLSDLFKQVSRPILLIAEDLHWATESIALLQQICYLVEAIPLMIIGSYRDDASPYLIGKFPTAHDIRLDRLTRDDIIKASESMLGKVGTQPQIVDLLERQSEGNAFFMIEIIRTLAEDVDHLSDIGNMTLPANVLAGEVQSLVQQRIDKIPEWAQHLLQYAAVIGREIDFDLLEHLNPPENPVIEDWLMLCANATILTIENGVWYFAHDKIRDAMLNRISPDDAKTYHHGVAVAIETVYGNDFDYVLALMHHWRWADDLEKVTTYCLSSCQRLLQISRFAEVIRWCIFLVGNLMNLTEHLRDDYQMQLSSYLATAYERVGEYEAAKVYFEKSIELAEQSSRNGMVASNYAGLSVVYRQQGLYHEGRDFAERSVTIYRQQQDEQGLADSLNKLGLLKIRLRDYQAAQSHFEESLALCHKHHMEYGISVAMHNLGLIADDQKDYDTAIQQYNKSLAIKQRIGDQYNMAATLNNLGLIYREQKELDKANETLMRSLNIKERIGDQFGIASTLGNLGSVAYSRCKHEESLDYYQRALQIFERIQNQWAIGVCHYLLGRTYHLLDDFTRADEHLQQGLTIFESIKNNEEIVRCKAMLAKNENALYFEWSAHGHLIDCLDILQKYPMLSHRHQVVVTACYIAPGKTDPEQVARWLGWLNQQPDIDQDTQLLMDDLQQTLSPQQVDSDFDVWSDIRQIFKKNEV